VRQDTMRPHADPMKRHARVGAGIVSFMLVMGVLSGGFAAAAAPKPAVTAAYFSSEPGSYVGASNTIVPPPDYLGQGHQFSFPNVTYVGRGPGESPKFQVSNGTDSFLVEFAPPNGKPLKPGAYENAQSYDYRPVGSPGLWVDGDGRGCGSTEGRFVVVDATYDRNLDPVSFSARFEDHCEGAAPALFGVLSYHSRAPFPTRELSTSDLNFNPLPPVGPESEPLSVTNTGSSVLTPSFAIVGTDATAFNVPATTCAASLAPGATCTYTITYTPGPTTQSQATFEYFDQLSPRGPPHEEAGAGTGWHVSLIGSSTG
jgi:hypothetical protein